MSEVCMCDACTRLGQYSHHQALGRSFRSQNLQIDNLRPSSYGFPPCSAYQNEQMLSQNTSRCLETDPNTQMLTIAQQFQDMLIHPRTRMEMSETKPRLGKEEVDILETEFKRNPKPTTSTKRQYAKDMGVDLSRINNWFRNRRAKRKQEKKQEAYKAKQAQEALGQNSEALSPSLRSANTLPIFNVFDKEHPKNDTNKSEEIKIKIDMDYHPEKTHQDENAPDLFSSSCMNAHNAILGSALDRREDEPEHLILPVLDPMRQALVERVMREFYHIFDRDWAARIIQCPGNHPPSSGDDRDFDTPINKVLLPVSSSKRQKTHNEDSADESSGKKPRRKRGGPRLPGESNNRARFACQFRKHDPQKYNIYSHRVCALTSWDTVARVKEHLYRTHKTAPFCKRCWKVFETEDLLDSHATVPANSICEVLPGHPPEGITPRQVAELRSKAKPYSTHNEADRWEDIFRLLFPGESVPSPYWEPIQEHLPTSPNSQDLLNYDNYMHRELPRLFRSRVEEVVSREMQPIEASLLANLEGLIRECQDQLSSGYREAHMTEQQPEVLLRQPMERLTDSVNQIDTTERLHTITVVTDQQSYSDFFDSVLQPPPVQEENYVLDFLAPDAELFDPNEHEISASVSESGYASVACCSCRGLCRCLVSILSPENRDIDSI